MYLVGAFLRTPSILSANQVARTNDCHRTNTRCTLLSPTTTIATAAAAYLLMTNAATSTPRVVDGILRSCAPTTLACVSTQDDAPASFIEPWSYDGTTEQAMGLIKSAIIAEDGVIDPPTDASFARYLRAVFRTGDEVELYFTENDNIVQVRADGMSHPRFDFGRNRNRVNRLRLRAGLDVVPVLRGRLSKLGGVLESPFDEFAPTLPSTDDFIDRVREGDTLLDRS